MILQREVVVPVWGDAPEGTVVSVSFNGQHFEDTARGGRWKVSLPPMPASADPRTLRVVASDGFKAEFTGVLVGDVWLASGQSNMAMSLASAKGGARGGSCLHQSASALFYGIHQIGDGRPSRGRSMESLRP